MKKLSFFIIHFLFISNSYCQWHRIVDIGCDDCHKVLFLNNEKGFITGHFQRNSILRTLDGGVSWDITEIPYSTNTFNATDIYFTDADTGFFAGYFIKGHTTINGGNSWSQINSNISSLYFDNIYFLNTKLGYGCYKYWYCHKTMDGGENWIQDSTLMGVSQIQFIDDSAGFAIGDYSLMVTTDQGANWEEKLIENESFYNRISFRNKNYGFAAGKKIARTFDGGDSWDFYTLPGSSTITDIQMVSDSIGYASGFYGKMYKTIDGGNNWYPQEVTSSAFYVRSINCPSPDTCYAVSQHGAIFKTTNGGGPLIGVGIKESERIKNIPIFPNPASDIITIPVITNPSTIKLFDFSGELIITEQIGSKENHQIDISSLPAGLYIVVVENEEGVFREKLVKR